MLLAKNVLNRTKVLLSKAGPVKYKSKTEKYICK